MERWASRHSHIDFFIMENGFITIHRRLLKWEWYNKPEMVSLFLTLLLLANNEKNRWQGHEINRGQLITGLHSLSKTTGISIQTIKTCLARLKSTGEITSKSTNKFRIITIVKYNDYQDKEKKSTGRLTSKLTNNQQTTNKQLTTNKNNNTEESKKKKRIKKEFIPPSLVEVENYFLENGYKKEIGKKAWMGYDVANWYDTGGKPVLNWKQKMINVWFKNENKEPIQMLP